MLEREREQSNPWLKGKQLCLLLYLRIEMIVLITAAVGEARGLERGDGREDWQSEAPGRLRAQVAEAPSITPSSDRCWKETEIRRSLSANQRAAGS